MAQQKSPLDNPEGLQQSSLIYPSSLVVVHDLPDACDSDDVQKSLRDACGSSNDCVSDVRVMKYGQGKLNIPSTMKYATASVRSAKGEIMNFSILFRKSSDLYFSTVDSI